jgi:hypothetical protein
MGGDRVTVLRMNGNGIKDIVAKLKEFREKIREMS